MNQSYNISLGFTADTSQAQRSIQQLEQSLSKLTSASNSNGEPIKITTQLKEASVAAGQLKAMLSSSMNVNTGKLDLSKFSQQMKQSGVDLDYFRRTLTAAGTDGQRAFLNLTKSITQAEVTLNRTKMMADKLFVSLKNTAKWQLSSTILHGFMSAVQTSISYVKDLNESLNNIRIVTGANIEEMSRFAEQANRAAKALSTTTTEYTNASLIYYQQGLSTEEVQKRTDVTIKMANAAGQSAETVSDQLTAVWNNFYDGTKSLEYYADVMTALGAATASSTDEIAGGLEKFAAVGETIGLSYEYATAALATITSNTRQSEEVVGTALKTIFARIQGLKLGETLEDGTTLNQYSEALEKVGVNIFDQNNALKNMDDILVDIAKKWQTLGRDQQTALAQSVAGVRQYTHFISLMDEWDSGDNDSMMANLETVKNSEGTLQEQADIYAESWEAASDRVTAATEAIYSNLLDDEFIINLLNGFEKLLTGVNMFINSIGGVPGILSGIGVIATSLFGNQLSQIFNNLSMDIGTLLGQESALQQQAANLATEIMSQKAVETNTAYNLASREREYEVEKQLLELRNKRTSVASQLGENELKIFDYLMLQNEALGQQAIKYAELQDKARLEGMDIFNDLVFDFGNEKLFEPIQAGMEEFAASTKGAGASLTDYVNHLLGAEEGQLKFGEVLDAAKVPYEQQNQIIKSIVKTYYEMGQACNNGKISLDNFGKIVNSTNDYLAQGQLKVKTFGETMTATLSGVSRLSMGLNSLQGIWDTLNNQDLSTFEKFTQLSMSISMGAMMLTSGYKELKKAILETALVQDILNAKQTIKIAQDNLELKTTLEKNAQELIELGNSEMSGDLYTKNLAKQTLLLIAEKEGIEVDKDAANSTIAKTLAEKLNLEVSKNASTSEVALAYAKKINIDKTNKSTIAILAENVAKRLNIDTTDKSTAAILKEIAAKKASAAASKLLNPYVLAAAAAIAALTTVIYLGIEAYNKDANAAERSAKAYEKMKESSEELSQELENIKSAFDGYESAYEALEKCTKGSDEWYEALKNVRSEIEKILLEFPEVAQFLTGFENGIPIFDMDAVNDYIAQQESKFSVANQVTMMQGIQTEKDQLKSDVTDLGREMFNLTSKVEIFRENFEYLGSLLTESQFKTALIQLGLATIDTVDNYIQYQEQIKKLARELAEIDLSEENLIKLFTSNNTGGETEGFVSQAKVQAWKNNNFDNQHLLGSQYGGIRETLYGIPEISFKALQKDYLLGSRKDENGEYKSVTLDSIWDEYQDITGIAQELSKNEAIVKDGVRYLQYQDNDNDGEAELVTIDEVLNTIEKHYAEIASDKAALAASDTYGKMSSDEKQFADYVAMNQNAEGKVNFNDYLSGLSGDIVNSLINLPGPEADPDEVGNAWNSVDIIAETLGMSGKALRDVANTLGMSVGDLLSNLKSSTGLIEQTLTSIPNEIKTAISGTGMSTGDQLNLAKTYQNAEEKGLTTALDGVMGTLTKNFKGQSDETLSLIAETDWTVKEEVDQFRAEMENVKQALKKELGEGFDTEDFDKNVDNIVETMKKINFKPIDDSDIKNLETSVSNFREKIKSISGIISDLDFGDTISKEDYLALGAGYEEYFTLMSDGTYKLITDAETFYNTVMGNQRASLAEDMSNTAGKIVDTQNFISDMDTVPHSNSAGGINERFNILQESGAIPSSQLEEWKKNIFSYKEEINTAFNELYDSMSNSVQEGKQALWDSQEAYLSTASSMTEYLNLYDVVYEKSQGLGVSLEAEKNSLLGVASQYQNAKDEALAYQAAIAAAEEDPSRLSDVNVAKDNLITAGLAGENAEAYGIMAESIEEIAEAYKEMGEAGEDGFERIKDNPKALTEAATNYIRLNNAVLDLSENYPEYSSVLKDVQSAQNKTDKAFAASSASGKKLQKSLSDLLGTSEDLINTDLLDAIDPEDFEAAARGDEAAIGRIRSEFIKLQAEAAGIDFSELQKELDKLEEGATLNLDTDSFLSDLITAKLNAGATATDLRNLLSGFGITMDNIQFYDSLEAAEEAAKASGGVIVDELSYSQETTTDATTVEKNGTTLGFTETVTAEPITETNKITETDEQGNITTIELPSTVYQYKKTVQEDEIPTQSSDTVVQNETTTKNGAGQTGDTGGGNKFAVVTGTKSVGNNVSTGTKNTANNNVNNATKPSGGSGGGGSSSKPKKAEKKKKTDVVERYKKIEDKLDDVRDAQDKASKSADRLYGADRLKQMQKINQALTEEVELLKDKKAEAEAYLKVDQQELDKVAKENRISFIYDEKGNISNYEEEMTKLWNELNNAVESANADGNATEEEQERIDEIQERIDTIKEALEQYEETRELIEDIESELQDKIYEIQDNNFEQLNYELEVKMEISGNSLEWIEYQLEKLEDDFYRAAEAAALLVGIVNGGNLDIRESQYQVIKDQKEINEKYFADAENKYKVEKMEDGNSVIAQSHFIEALKTSRDAAYEQLSALNELDDAMMNYYGDTLEKAMEELAKYTDQMEHLNSVLDHYSSLMSIMGKEKDYKSMGIILRGQAKLAEDRLTAAEATFNMLTSEKDDAYTKWQTALKNDNAAAAELYEKEYRAALEKANEAEEEFLESAEETLEVWRAELENALNEMGDNLEKALSGGKGFDWITSTLERMNSLHEEYLTTTNKIYETNKLINKMQQEIDKTSNTVAKRKFKELINSTKQMSEQTALSKFELEIQQAKYELLLAEIALEEAQNAKSQVRLQRDSEGNFGYVYTADESKIADAQQQYQDAENNLYNISLEGANKYTEQRRQLELDFVDTMKELEQQWLEGSFTSTEEYQAAQIEAQEFYQERMRQALELYYIAIGADSKAAAESLLGDQNLLYDGSFTSFSGIAEEWKNIHIDMLSDSNTWKVAVEEYVNGVIGKFNEWDSLCQTISEKTHLDNLAGKVQGIVKESENLVTDLIKKDGVLDSLDDELEKVKDITEAYGLQRKAIQELIVEIENYVKALNERQMAEAKINEMTEKEKNNNSSNNNNNNSNNNNSNGNNNLSIDWGINQIHKGLWGNGWNNRWEYAKAAGYTEGQFEQIKQYIIDYYNKSSYNNSSYNKTKSSAVLERKNIEEKNTKDLEEKNALEKQQQADRDRWAKKMAGYDTGGYTGEWGSYGKLGILHEKELILNKDDTKNWLSSIQEINKTLELYEKNLQMETRLRSYRLNNQKQELQQIVTIEASFPGITEHNELELAFSNLVNEASQYAYRYYK